MIWHMVLWRLGNKNKILKDGINMDIKIAELMLKFITKVCNKHRGLCVTRYSKGVSDNIVYKFEWCDCG